MEKSKKKIVSILFFVTLLVLFIIFILGIIYYNLYYINQKNESLENELKNKRKETYKLLKEYFQKENIQDISSFEDKFVLQHPKKNKKIIINNTNTNNTNNNEQQTNFLKTKQEKINVKNDNTVSIENDKKTIESLINNDITKIVHKDFEDLLYSEEAINTTEQQRRTLEGILNLVEQFSAIEFVDIDLDDSGNNRFNLQKSIITSDSTQSPFHTSDATQSPFYTYDSNINENIILEEKGKIEIIEDLQ